MKFLLTSSGLTNNSIKQALLDLIGDQEVRIAFIPTAGIHMDNDKVWLLRQLQEFHELGYLDIVEISALPKENWLPRLEKANVIVVGGGKTQFLIERIRESGFDQEIRRLIEDGRIYVGISAGSICAAPRVWCGSEYLFDKQYNEAPEGMNLVNVHLRSHYQSEGFPKVTKENLEVASKNNPGIAIYATDDQSAVKVVDGVIEIITEGTCDVFGNNL